MHVQFQTQAPTKTQENSTLLHWYFVSRSQLLVYMLNV